jgi:hypothetical protein
MMPMSGANQLTKAEVCAPTKFGLPGTLIIIGTFSVATQCTVATVRKWTPVRHAIGSHAWPGFNPSNGANPNGILEAISLFKTEPCSVGGPQHIHGRSLGLVAESMVQE